MKISQKVGSALLREVAHIIGVGNCWLASETADCTLRPLSLAYLDASSYRSRFEVFVTLSHIYVAHLSSRAESQTGQ